MVTLSHKTQLINILEDNLIGYTHVKSGISPSFELTLQKPHNDVLTKEEFYNLIIRAESNEALDTVINIILELDRSNILYYSGSLAAYLFDEYAEYATPDELTEITHMDAYVQEDISGRAKVVGFRNIDYDTYFQLRHLKLPTFPEALTEWTMECYLKPTFVLDNSYFSFHGDTITQYIPLVFIQPSSAPTGYHVCRLYNGVGAGVYDYVESHFANLNWYRLRLVFTPTKSELWVDNVLILTNNNFICPSTTHMHLALYQLPISGQTYGVFHYMDSLDFSWCENWVADRLYTGLYPDPTYPFYLESDIGFEAEEGTEAELSIMARWDNS